MAIQLSDNIFVGQQKPVEAKYFDGLQPWANTAAANTGILTPVRYRGLTVNINGVEYWYKDGIANGDLVIKTAGGSGTVQSIATSSPLTGGTITVNGTIGIQQASGSQDGYLSLGDWTIFNGKQNAITTGTTAQYFRGDLSLATFPTIPTVTPSALTKTDDTNITLSLTGTPTTALLQAVQITAGWTGTLADNRITSATAWNAKEPGISAGTTSQYWRGDKTWQTFPTIPAAQIQSDWNQSNNTLLDFIKNKPTIPTVGTWGALNYPTWTTGTPFVKMDAAGSFILDTTVYQPLLVNPVLGTGTQNFVTKWSTTGSTLADSIIFDNGTSVGIGTASPNALNKLEVAGTIASTSGINLDTTANTKTGIYAGSNTMNFFAGNAQLATYRLNGNVVGSYFEHTAGFTNNGSVASGSQNVWRIAAGVTATTAINTIDVTQLLIDPTYSQSTFGTGKLRGVYYNPSAGVGTSIHRAWENTSGDIIHGNLAFTGSTNKVLTVDSVGKLVNDDLVTNFVKYNDILTQPNFSGRTVYVSPLAMSAGLFSTSFNSITQAQWIITDTSLAGGVRNGKIRRYQWKNTYTPVIPAFTGSTSGTTLTTVGSPALTSGMWIRLDDGTGLGRIQSGSGDSWTLDVSTSFPSQNMNAYLGNRNVYSQGFLYFGFWNNGGPATITATFKSQQFSATAGSIQDWGTTVNGVNISVSAVHSYWRVPIPVLNYLTDIEVTFTPDATNDIDYKTQEMVVNFAEGIDVIPFINKDGGNMYGTLSFLSGSNGLASNIKGRITNAGALTMATGTFTALPTSTTNTEMVSINSTTGVLSKQAIPTGLPPSGTAGGDLDGTFPSPTVAKIQGNSISSTTPTTNQVLQYNGSSWVPATISLSTVYQNEIHVSKDGSDATGDGTLLKPYATITQGLTLVAGTRKTIVLHPGSYSESPNITVQFTVITTFELLGGNTEIVGTVSTSTGCTISGIKMTNLTISNLTGTGNVNVLNCDISGTLTKSSTGDYTLIRFCDIGTTSITSSAGTVAIFGGNPNFITVNNAGARVVVKNSTTVAPVLTAGSLSLVDCIIFATTGTSNAFTAAAGTYTTIANSQLIVPAFTNFARVSIAGFYSIINTIYDRTLSTLTGTSTNSIVNSQYINADKFIKQGGTSSQFLMADGSVTTGGSSPLTTKGDLYTFSTVDARLGVGSNGEVLIADSSTTTGLKWGTVTGFTRSVNVVSIATAAGNAAGTDYVYLVSGTTTITLPTAVGNTNRYTIKRSGAGVVSIATTSSQTIDGSSSPITINVQYVSIDLISNGTNWEII